MTEAAVTPAALPIRVAQRGSVAIAVAIGSAAFALSFFALNDLAIRAHVRDVLAWMWPLIIDLTIVQATLSLAILARPGMRAAGRERGYFWAVAAAAVLVSLTGGAAHALLPAGQMLSGPSAAAVATVAPVALLISTHSALLLMRQRITAPIVRAAQRLSVVIAVAIGSAAFALSFFALNDLAIRAHVPGSLAWMWPLIIDLTIVQATLSLVVLARPGMRAAGRERGYFWAVASAAVLVSLAGNAVHALLPAGQMLSGPSAAAVAAVAPVALLISTQSALLLMRSRIAPETVKTQVVEAPESVGAGGAVAGESGELSGLDTTAQVVEPHPLVAVGDGGSDDQADAGDAAGVEHLGARPTAAEETSDGDVAALTQQGEPSTALADVDGPEFESGIAREDGDLDMAAETVEGIAQVISQEMAGEPVVDPHVHYAAEYQLGADQSEVSAVATSETAAVLARGSRTRSRISDQQRNAIRRRLQQDPELSLRQIASLENVHHNTVARIRDELERDLLAAAAAHGADMEQYVLTP